MLKRLFVWVEDGIYNAVVRGCGRAARDLSGGEAVIDVLSVAGDSSSPDQLNDQTQPSLEAEPQQKPARKKAATRKR
jgi:hypothetical protein